MLLSTEKNQGLSQEYCDMSDMTVYLKLRNWIPLSTCSAHGILTIGHLFVGFRTFCIFPFKLPIFQQPK